MKRIFLNDYLIKQTFYFIYLSSIPLQVIVSCLKELITLKLIFSNIFLCLLQQRFHLQFPHCKQHKMPKIDVSHERIHISLLNSWIYPSLNFNIPQSFIFVSTGNEQHLFPFHTTQVSIPPGIHSSATTEGHLKHDSTDTASVFNLSSHILSETRTDFR